MLLDPVGRAAAAAAVAIVTGAIATLSSEARVHDPSCNGEKKTMTAAAITEMRGD